MQPSITPSPSARAACAIRTASRIPPDLASLTLIAVRALGAERDVGERVAVLVDVDRDRRAALQLGPVRDRRPAAAARSTRAASAAGSSSASSSVQYSLTSTWSGSVGRGADGADALEVEPVAAAELQLQPPEAALRGRLGPARHVVGVAEPDRPRGRRARRAAARAACRPARRRASPAGRAAPRRPRRARPARPAAARRRSRRAPTGRRRARPPRATRARRRPTRRSARSAPPRRTRRRRRAGSRPATTSASSCDSRAITKVSASAQRSTIRARQLHAG